MTALGSALTASGPALAGDPALAESLFQQARADMDAGNYAAACPKLAESYEQDPGTGALLALAVCREQLGQTASAWAVFAEVVSRSKQEGRADREQAAREHLDALTPRLSRLTVAVAPGVAAIPGLIVKRNGIVLGSAAWGNAAPVDPGDHVVEASAPGYRVRTVAVRVGAASDSQVARIDGLDAAGAGAPAASPGAPAPYPPPPGAPPPSAPSTERREAGAPLRTVGLVAGAAGLVTLGVSGYFALHATSLNRSSKEDGHCDAANSCDSLGLARRDDASSAATVATITFLAGSVLAATGITLFLVGGPKDERTAHVQATPVVGSTGGEMVIHGSF